MFSSDKSTEKEIKAMNEAWQKKKECCRITAQTCKVGSQILVLVDEGTTVLDLKQMTERQLACGFEVRLQVARLDSGGENLRDEKILMSIGVKKWDYVHILKIREPRKTEEGLKPKDAQNTQEEQDGGQISAWEGTGHCQRGMPKPSS